MTQSGGERKHEIVENEAPDNVQHRNHRDPRWCGGVEGREHEPSWQYWFGPRGARYTQRANGAFQRLEGREYEYQKQRCLRCHRHLKTRAVYCDVPPNSPGAIRQR